MCRLFGYFATGPASAVQLAGAADFAEFTRLSTQHADGWGAAWCRADGSIGVAREPVAAHTSPRYGELTTEPISDRVLLHLRWATPPHAVTTENTHPFVAGDLAFAHNGAIWPVAELESLLDEPVRDSLSGTTDSERYFALVRTALRTAGGDVVEALRTTTALISGRLAASSLNCLLLTADALYAVCCYDEANQPLPDQPDYFALNWRRQQDAIVVSSSGWSTTDWDRVPNGTVLVVRRDATGGRLTAESVPLDSTTRPKASAKPPPLRSDPEAGRVAS